MLINIFSQLRLHLMSQCSQSFWQTGHPPSEWKFIFSKGGIHQPADLLEVWLKTSNFWSFCFAFLCASFGFLFVCFPWEGFDLLLAMPNQIDCKVLAERKHQRIMVSKQGVRLEWHHIIQTRRWNMLHTCLSPHNVIRRNIEDMWDVFIFMNCS